jgi:glycosyltransferase involved in cell wall biosynthesis
MSEVSPSELIEAGPPEAPAVSVIIPAYNTVAYIAEALDTVFAQTFTDFEVIVINDGSPDTDQLEKVLEPYLERIVYLKQENRGPSAARNAGIRRSRGEFLAFLDSDDIWDREYLASQMEYFQKDAKLDLIYSDFLYHGDSEKSGKSYMEMYPPKGRVTFENLMKREYLIFPSTTVLRKSAVVGAGLFDEDLHRSEDFDLFIRIAHRGGKIAYHRKALARRLIHLESLSFVGTRMLDAEDKVLRKLDKTLDLTPRQRRLLQRRIAQPLAEQEADQGKECLRVADYSGARKSLGRAYGLRSTAKLWAVLLGLRIAPGWTRATVRTWYQVLSGLKRFRTIAGGL